MRGALSIEFTPGSFAWYLRHEFRNAWRRDPRASKRVTRLLLCLFIGLHVVAMPVGFMARRLSHYQFEPPIFALSAGILIVFLLMLPTALLAATQAVYVRGDIDLLASSPARLRKILAIRAGATAIGVVGLWAFLLTPFANVVAGFGQWRALGVYPLLIGLGVMASGSGMAVAYVLFGLIGPKHTRTLAQVLGALAGAVAIFALQAPNIATRSAKENFWAWVFSSDASRGFGPLHPMSWPARALMGEPLPVLGFTAMCLMVFGLALWAFTEQFAANAAAVAGAGLDARKRRAADAPLKAFRTGLRRVLFAKEWRLLLRDPWLISQTLFQILYMLPLLAVFFRRHLEETIGVGGLAPLTVIIAGQIAGGLVWLTIAGEDSPELLATAPVRAGQVFGAKLMAAILPVAAIIGAPLLFVATQDLEAAGWALAGSIASAGSATLLGLTMRRAQGHKAFNHRYKGAPLMPVVEMTMNIAWAGAVSLTIDENEWAFAPASGAILLLLSVMLLRNIWNAPSRPARRSGLVTITTAA